MDFSVWELIDISPLIQETLGPSVIRGSGEIIGEDISVFTGTISSDDKSGVVITSDTGDIFTI